MCMCMFIYIYMVFDCDVQHGIYFVVLGCPASHVYMVVCDHRQRAEAGSETVLQPSIDLFHLLLELISVRKICWSAAGNAKAFHLLTAHGHRCERRCVFSLFYILERSDKPRNTITAARCSHKPWRQTWCHRPTSR